MRLRWWIVRVWTLLLGRRLRYRPGHALEGRAWWFGQWREVQLQKRISGVYMTADARALASLCARTPLTDLFDEEGS